MFEQSENYRVSQQVLDGMLFSEDLKAEKKYLENVCQKNRQIEGISALFSKNLNKLSRFLLDIFFYSVTN